MAIVKLLRIKPNADRKPSAGLQQALRYIANPAKTENMLLTGGSSGGDPELTYADMIANKESWRKLDGTQGYHYILSLPPDEHPDTATMRALTEEFCQQLLQDHYLYAYAIHSDKDHLHAHIIFDSVNLQTGLMYQSGRYDWLARIMPIANRLCAKYGLRSLELEPKNREERRNKYHNEWEKEKDHENVLKIKRNVSWNDLIKADIDAALIKSHTWSEFILLLLDAHYEVKDGKNLSVRPEGKERYVRTGRLGESYTKERLLKRLGESQGKEQGLADPEPLLRALREYLEQTGTPEIAGIKKIYYERWYAYSYVNRCKTPWRYRSQVTDLGKYTQRCEYLFRHDLSSEADLQGHISQLQEQQTATKKELIRVQNQIYNSPLSSWRRLEKLRGQLAIASEMEKPEIQAKITALVTELKSHDLTADAAKYRELQERKAELQARHRQLAADLKIATDLVQDFEMCHEPDDIMQDPGRFVPQPFSSHSYQRITVNKVLIRETSPGADFIKVKIPGTSKEFLLIYRDDVKFAADKSYASCYLYEHIDYKVVDKDNLLVKTISGREAMTHFADRTPERSRYVR